MVHSQIVTLTKAARLCVLLDLDERGLLAGKSLAVIAGWFGVQRSTILRDRRLLPQVRRMREQIKRRVK